MPYLADYHISIDPGYHDMGDAIAAVNPDIYEKELKIKLSTGFRGLSVTRQRNILIHELVHARVNIYEQKISALQAEEQEYMVNDLVRGLELIK